MEVGKTLYVTQRSEWREWLSANHGTEKEIWLIGYRKEAGKPGLPYNDAVEEALCFGWIDSTMKKVDAERNAQRYTPRRPNSPLSEMNKERVRRLIAAGLMTPAGLAAAGDLSTENFTIAEIFFRHSRQTRRSGRISAPSLKATSASASAGSKAPANARRNLKKG